MKDKIIVRVLTGPTASGKSDLAIRLAEKHGWEIVCMDSMQIYRGLDIGTAKPSLEDRRRVPHHLLDIRDPSDAFSVSEYRSLAEELLYSKASREGKQCLLVGGTGLYLISMSQPFSIGSVPADPILREKLNRLADSPEGRKELHALLASLDSASASRLPVNDVRRSIRAIEVSLQTGIPFSQQPPRKEVSPFDFRVAVTAWPRDLLYARINSRVLRMLDAGLEEETRRLLSEGVLPSAQSMQAIGYKEMVRFIRGLSTLPDTIDAIQKATRHYAKRQQTFFRRDPAWIPFDAAEADALLQAEKILQ